jgi:hypothetical protein
LLIQQISVRTGTEGRQPENMNMDKTSKWTLFAAVALLGAGVTLYGPYGLMAVQSQPQAAPISGSISIKGGAEISSTSVNTATQVTSWLNGAGAKPTVVSRSGSFSKYVTAGASVTMAAPWNFNSGPLPALWSVGGFTFDLTASTITQQGKGFLAVTGTGTITGNGFDPTPGTWRFSTQNLPARGVFSFSASTTASPPTRAPTPTP